MKTNKHGFSLIEMLVYTSVLVLMLAIIIQVIFSIARADRIIKSARRVENSAILSMERISRELRWADSVDTSSSILDTHPGVLVLEGIDEGGDPRTIEFYLSSGLVMIRENAVELGALTENAATTTSLIFRHFSASDSEGVRTEMSIESGTSTHYRAETFYSSALLR